MRISVNALVFKFDFYIFYIQLIKNKMDFIVSYHLYNQIIKKEENSKKIKPVPEKESEPGQNTINHTCPRCGQDPYFCQCKNNIKSMFKYFNPEKDNY